MKTIKDYIKAIEEVKAMGLDIIMHSKDSNDKLDEIENMDIHLQCCLNILTKENDDIEEYYDDIEYYSPEEIDILAKVNNIMDNIDDDYYLKITDILYDYTDDMVNNLDKVQKVCEDLNITVKELMLWYEEE